MRRCPLQFFLPGIYRSGARRPYATFVVKIYNYACDRLLSRLSIRAVEGI